MAPLRQDSSPSTPWDFRSVRSLITIIPEIAEGRVIVVESGADSAKSFFVRRLGLTAMNRKSKVTFVISRDRGELSSQLEKEGKMPDWMESSVVIHVEDEVDSFDHFAPEGVFWRSIRSPS